MSLDALRARAEEVARLDREAKTGWHVRDPEPRPPSVIGGRPSSAVMVRDQEGVWVADCGRTQHDHAETHATLIAHYRTACPRWAAAAMLLAEAADAVVDESNATEAVLQDRIRDLRDALAQAVRTVEGEVRDA